MKKIAWALFIAAATSAPAVYADAVLQKDQSDVKHDTGEVSSDQHDIRMDTRDLAAAKSRLGRMQKLEARYQRDGDTKNAQILAGQIKEQEDKIAALENDMSKNKTELSKDRVIENRDKSRLNRALKKEESGQK